MVTYKVPSIGDNREFIAESSASVDHSAYWPTIPYTSATTLQAQMKPDVASEEHINHNVTRRIRLPIHSSIAERRAISSSPDSADIEREQYSRRMHEIALLTVPLKDVNTTFREVDWESGEGSEASAQRMLTRINEGEPLSLRTKPRVEQMSFKEYRLAVGNGEVKQTGGVVKQRT